MLLRTDGSGATDGAGRSVGKGAEVRTEADCELRTRPDTIGGLCVELLGAATILEGWGGAGKEEPDEIVVRFSVADDRDKVGPRPFEDPTSTGTGRTVRVNVGFEGELSTTGWTVGRPSVKLGVTNAEAIPVIPAGGTPGKMVTRFVMVTSASPGSLAWSGTASLSTTTNK